MVTALVVVKVEVEEKERNRAATVVVDRGKAWRQMCSKAYYATHSDYRCFAVGRGWLACVIGILN